MDNQRIYFQNIKRSLNNILTILLLVLCLKFPIPNSLNNKVKALESKEKKEEKFKEFEREDLRTQTSKIFQTSNNSFRYEGHSDKIHFDDGGKYKDVNSEIIPEQKGKFLYKNKANDFTFRIGEKVSDGVLFERNGESCEFRLFDVKSTLLEDKMLTISNNVVIYKDIYPGANLEFSILSTGVRTEFVIKEKFNIPEEVTFDLINCDEKIFDQAVFYDEKDSGKIHTFIEERANTKGLNANSNSRNIENSSSATKKLILKPDYSQIGEINGELNPKKKY